MLVTTPSLWNDARYAEKIGSETGEVTALNLAEWPQPFEATYETDAHFWPYVIYVDGQISELQISVKVQNQAPKAISSDEAVLMHYLVLEYDTPDHGSMSAEERQALLQLFDMAPEDSPVKKLACFYWTNGGCRFVYRLKQPISYERYASKLRGLAKLMADQTGIECDWHCAEWWRCYRLPRVVREGKGPTWETDWFQCLMDEVLLDEQDVPAWTSKLPWQPASKTTQAPEAQPEASAAMALVASGAFQKACKRLLKDNAVFPYLWEGMQPREGERDHIIMHAAGSVTKALFGKIELLGAEHIYGLLYPMVDDIETTGEPLANKLWRLVQHSWNAEAEKQQSKDLFIEECKSAQEKLVDMVIKAHPPEGVPSDPDQKVPWALKRLLLARKGKACYVFKPDTGTYSIEPLSIQQVPAHMRDAFPYVSAIYTEKGGLKNGQTLCHEFSINLSNLGVQYVTGLRRGCAVTHRDGEVKLHITPYEIRRDVIEHAEHNFHVSQFLLAMGTDAANKICAALTALPAVSLGPTAALSLRGPKGSGKSMLSLACAEIFSETVVSGSEAFSRFNEGLVRTPVVICDEALPRKTSDGIAVPDAFRTMQSGMHYPIEGKFGCVDMSSIPLRFIMSANNNNVIRSLAGSGVNERNDTDALVQRVIHVDVDPSASDYLASNGGRAFTKDWVGGDPRHGGCKLARHIVWLYMQALDNQSLSIRQRFLVEGDMDSRLVALLESGGCSPEVAYLLIQDIERVQQKSIAGTNYLIVQHDGKEAGVWIKKMDWVRHACTRIETRVSPQEIRRVLERWLTGREIRIGNQSYTKLRLQEVIDIARLENIDCDAAVNVQQRLQEAAA